MQKMSFTLGRRPGRSYAIVGNVIEAKEIEQMARISMPKCLIFNMQCPYIHLFDILLQIGLQAKIPKDGPFESVLQVAIAVAQDYLKRLNDIAQVRLGGVMQEADGGKGRIGQMGYQHAVLGNTVELLALAAEPTNL